MKTDIIPPSTLLHRQLNWLKLTITILLLMGIVALFPACSGQPASQTADFGQEIILTPGQKVSLADDELVLRFVEAVNDSRCPTGVQCIWAGEVSVKVGIEYQGQTKSMVLTQSGSSESDTRLLDFRISFDVQPYPEAEKQLKAADYRLCLVVTRDP